MSECSFAGCPNKRLSSKTDICASHRRQLLRDGSLTALGVRNKASNGMKRCVECGVVKELSLFSPYSAGKNYYHPACTTCQPRYNKRNLIKSKYKMALEDYEKIVAAGCEVCAATENVVLDHDHSCCPTERTCGNCIRGALCSNCNRAEGYLRSNPANALKLYEYMRKNG